jgi:hypothetical protein
MPIHSPESIATRSLRRIWLRIVLLLALLLALIPGAAQAQTYSFSVDMEAVDVYWNEDGTSAIEYVFVFNNDPRASPIDFVDVGVPNANYDITSVQAEIDGQPAAGIEISPYVQPGIAVNLGRYAIRPGESGQVRVFIGRVRDVIHPDRDDPEYVSAAFGNTWFDSSFARGTTNLRITYHLPPGVQPEEPRWHSAPSGFPPEPETGFDEEGRITYTWHNPNASPSRQYTVGASFPARYVPQTAVIRPDPLAALWRFVDGLMTILPVLMCIGFFGLIIFVSVVSEKNRKLKYLPPKISIEGHGIKRGLTAIEAAILMEQPLDKVLTMILFSVVKKGAAQVVKRDPLQLDVISPRPQGLHEYEIDFLETFQTQNKAAQRKALQDMMIKLVKGLGNKMKGFSRRETIAYYQDIMNRAWAQVEAADTPEVKSAKFDEVMEWTMLDRKYEDRTRDVFRTGPVFVPNWYPRFDPTFRGGTTGAPAAPSTGGGKVAAPAPTGGSSMPTLPGSDFAGSIVTGAQGLASSVVGNLSDFTSSITRQTNPPPPPSPSSGSRGGGGGSSCACACACAGCACACAGGGR